MKFAWVIVLSMALLIAADRLAAVELELVKSTEQSFKSAYPGAQFLFEDDGRLSRIYGRPFGGGSNPIDAAERFKSNYAAMFGLEPDELVQVSAFNPELKTQGLMYDRSTGEPRFTLVYYSQFKAGLPVYDAELRLLVLNRPDHPIALAVVALKDLSQFRPEPAAMAADPLAVRSAFQSQIPEMPNTSEPRLVIWAGTPDETAKPRVAVEFVAWDSQPATMKKRFLIDAVTLEKLHEEDLVIDINITGQVNGLATENFKAEQCGNEITTPLRHAYVRIQGGDSAIADTGGYFTINNPGSSPVTVLSPIRGRWFRVYNQAGSATELSQTVTPPGPANFLHNSGNTEFTRAEVNGYYHANIVRDFTLSFNPTYPTIYNQINFPVYVNETGGYCPGNAWYDGVSITFCQSGGGYPNTAFSTIVHHEYGHHLVEMAGSGQGQYGEGMGDVMGLLITDDPGAAWGFYGPCNQALRSADNTLQYPCSGEIHYCGQLLSGCVWSTRNALAASYPSTYMSILADLAINAMLLHTGTSITPSITVDYLTLDDTDGNIYNGTPHRTEICTGFDAHNMTCPALQTGVFITHTPLGNTTSNSPYEVNAVITTTETSIDSAYIFWSNGGSYSPVSMTNLGAGNYRGYIPGQPNCTFVEYYIYATDNLHNTKRHPETGTHRFYVGTFDTLLFNNVENGTAGWTHTIVTSGYVDQWEIRNHRNHTSGGANAWKFGNSSSTESYANYADGGLISPSITLPADAKLQFWTWGAIEQSSSTAAWDGAIVEISLNGGPYTRITPVDGYTHSTVGGYSHPWPAATPCWSGNFDWQMKEFDLAAYAGNNINLRFRFGSDNSVAYEGWYIDDILITAPHCDSIETGVLSGIVTDNLGSVSGAVVHAVSGGNQGWDTTSAAGAYSMTLPVGSYSVAFAHIDHRDTTVLSVTIAADSTTMLDMVMTRLPGAIRGVITRAPSLPVAGLRAILSGGAEDTTDSGGNYGFFGLPDGDYSLTLNHPDYYDTTIANIAVTAGDTTFRNVTVRIRPGWLSGIVTDTGGVAIESVLVICNGAVILQIDSVYTGADGQFLIELTPDNYGINFVHPMFDDTTISDVVISPADTTSVSVELKPTDFPPVITSPDSTTAIEDFPFSYIAAAYDPNGHAVTIDIDRFASWLALSGDTLFGTPTEGKTDTSFRIIASDGLLADTQLVFIDVIPVNDPPRIISPEVSQATEHQPFAYTAMAVDPDGTTPDVSFSDYASWMTPWSQTIVGIPPEGAADTSFRIIASDGLLADTQIVAVDVIPVNDPPQITSPSSISAVEDQPFSYVAAASDPEGTTPVISFVRKPSWMTVAQDTIFGTALNGFVDTSFAVVASDGQSADTLVVLVDVIPVNDPPILTSPSTASASWGSVFEYLGTAVDIDNPVVAITYPLRPSWLAPIGDTLRGLTPSGAADTLFLIVASDGQLADSQLVNLSVSYSCLYVPGDINGDGNIIGGDVTFGVRFFKGLGANPPDSCYLDSTSSYLYVAGDVNGNCEFRGSDITRLVSYFKGTATITYCHFLPPGGALRIDRQAVGKIE